MEGELWSQETHFPIFAPEDYSLGNPCGFVTFLCCLGFLICKMGVSFLAQDHCVKVGVSVGSLNGVNQDQECQVCIRPLSLLLVTMATTTAIVTGSQGADTAKLLIVQNLTSSISLDPPNHSPNRLHFSYFADEESDTQSITTQLHHLPRSVHTVNTQIRESKFHALFEVWHEPHFLGQTLKPQ